MFRNDELIGEMTMNCAVRGSFASIYYQDCFGFYETLEGDDFFNILARIRRKYAEEGIALLCAGGLLDVYPGGLKSESSHGELAYRMDDKTGYKETVNIFDPIPCSDVSLLSDVSDQKNNREYVISKFYDF
tara:strand:- start:97 stop:489 length:393 start_codon:yes stop_codon:yes gene_type:complete